MSSRGFRSFAWSVLGFNLAVVLWGAYVRATGSGAGCGKHWPTCQGEVIPRSPAADTVIEFVHRLSSGVALLLVAGLVVWGWRAFAKGHPVRLGVVLSAVFIVSEALLGAGLVLFGWVAQDASVGRAWAMTAHLVNTFLLLGALTLTAWWASGGARFQLRGQGAIGVLLGLGVLAMVVLGISGAITALGDTLFPAESLAAGMALDLSPTAHVLIRLRVIHPILAVGVGVYLALAAAVTASFRHSAQVKRFVGMLVGLFAVQILAGTINLILLAPVWMQLVHLLLADLVWISLVLLTASAFAQPHARGEVAGASAHGS